MRSALPTVCWSLRAVLVTWAVSGVVAQTAPAAAPPVTLSAVDDYKRVCALLHVEPILTRPKYNYDESKATPFPNLPDPLKLKNGDVVKDADTWWNKRRPEILEDFEREVYGRTPKITPKVKWEVTSSTRGMNGTVAIVTKQLVGHVDNSSYPQVTVDIGVIMTTPADAKGPVPVMLQFSGVGFGFPGGSGPGRGRGPSTAPATTPASRPAAAGAMIEPFVGDSGMLYPIAAGRAPGGAPRGAGGPGAGGGGPTWQQQCLAKGWGYALLNTGSVQADNGAGLERGIIGLVNKGQPRGLEDWGVLSAWSWGASRALDYFETDPAVDAKQVGLEGHSRWGKATALAMALDQRFAIAYVSSSGEGGVRLHRRDFGEPLDAVAIPDEYYWMGENFLKYMHRKWDDLPVDSHELIALCAPRPVMITGGTQADQGADAKGMFMAAAAAGPVYKLLGKKDLGATEMAPPNVAMIDGDIAFRHHEGGHTDALDWPTFILFASRYFHTADSPVKQ